MTVYETLAKEILNSVGGRDNVNSLTPVSYTHLDVYKRQNIDSLAVGETENENYSRITITTSGDAASVNQIKLQLDKLEDVRCV